MLRPETPVPGLIDLIRRGDRIQAIRFIESLPHSTNIIDSNGRDVSIWASIYGHLEILRFVIDRGIDISRKDNDLRTSLAWAAEKGHGDVVKFLIQKGSNINQFEKEGRTPLNLAVIAGKFNTASILLDSGADPDLKDGYGCAPITWCCINGNIDLVQLLIDKQADVDTQENDGRTPISFASSEGYLDIVKLLLWRNADCNITDKFGYTPLCWASEMGQTSIVRLLVLVNGIDINHLDEESRTPLSLASIKGHEETVEALLAAGVDIHQYDMHGWTALSLAAIEGHHKIVKMLISKGAEVNVSDYDERSVLCASCVRGHEEVVKLLIAAGADLNSRDKNGNSPVSIAVTERHLGILRLLLQAGANLQDDRAMLSAVCIDGQLDVVNLLLDHGADVNYAGSDEYTPLQCVCAEGHLVIAKVLLEHGADVEITDRDGRTALSLACIKGHGEVVRLLIRSDANIDVVDHHGVAPLWIACHLGYLNIAKMLIENGAKLDLCLEYGKTPMRLLIDKGEFETISMMIDRGVDLSVVDENGRTYLDWACIRGHIDIVTLLLDQGVETDELDHFSRPAVSYASEAGDAEIVALLAERGADVNIQDANGRTALCWAAVQGHVQVVAVLVAYGADTTLVEENGMTALNLACREGHKPVAAILSNRERASSHLQIQQNSNNTNNITSPLPPSGRPGSPALQSSLKIAIDRDHMDLAIMLVEKGADPAIFLDELPKLFDEKGSANLFLKDWSTNLFTAIHNYWGQHAKLVHILVTFAYEIKVAIRSFPKEKGPLIERLEQVQYMIFEAIQTPRIAAEEAQLLDVLLADQFQNHSLAATSIPFYKNKVVSEGYSLFTGPLSVVMDYKIGGLLNSVPINKMLDGIFWGCLRHCEEDFNTIVTKDRSIVWVQLCKLRNNLRFARYAPALVLFSECVAEVLILCLVAAVSLVVYDRNDQKLDWDGYQNKSLVISLAYMIVMNILYQWGSGILFDKSMWTLPRTLSNILLLTWIPLMALRRDVLELPAIAVLSSAAIPLSLLPLQYISMFSFDMADVSLRIILAAMDVWGVILILLSVTMGFGITLAAIRSEDILLSSSMRTALTLFEAAIGNPDFYLHDDSKNLESRIVYLGLFLLALFTGGTCLILINFLIARMTVKYSELNGVVRQTLEFDRARLIRRCTLIHERNPLCMLAAPFSIIPIFFAVIHYLFLFPLYVTNLCFQAPSLDDDARGVPRIVSSYDSKDSTVQATQKNILHVALGDSPKSSSIRPRNLSSESFADLYLTGVAKNNQQFLLKTSVSISGTISDVCVSALVTPLTAFLSMLIFLREVYLLNHLNTSNNSRFFTYNHIVFSLKTFVTIVFGYPLFLLNELWVALSSFELVRVRILDTHNYIATDSRNHDVRYKQRSRLNQFHGTVIQYPVETEPRVHEKKHLDSGSATTAAIGGVSGSVGTGAEKAVVSKEFLPSSLQPKHLERPSVNIKGIETIYNIKENESMKDKFDQNNESKVPEMNFLSSAINLNDDYTTPINPAQSLASRHLSSRPSNIHSDNPGGLSAQSPASHHSHISEHLSYGRQTSDRFDMIPHTNQSINITSNSMSYPPHNITPIHHNQLLSAAHSNSFVNSDRHVADTEIIRRSPIKFNRQSFGKARVESIQLAFDADSEFKISGDLHTNNSNNTSNSSGNNNNNNNNSNNSNQNQYNMNRQKLDYNDEGSMRPNLSNNYTRLGSREIITKPSGEIKSEGNIQNDSEISDDLGELFSKEDRRRIFESVLTDIYKPKISTIHDLGIYIAKQIVTGSSSETSHYLDLKKRQDRLAHQLDIQRQMQQQREIDQANDQAWLVTMLEKQGEQEAFRANEQELERARLRALLDYQGNLIREVDMRREQDHNKLMAAIDKLGAQQAGRDSTQVAERTLVITMLEHLTRQYAKRETEMGIRDIAQARRETSQSEELLRLTKAIEAEAQRSYDRESRYMEKVASLQDTVDRLGEKILKLENLAVLKADLYDQIDNDQKLSRSASASPLPSNSMTAGSNSTSTARTMASSTSSGRKGRKGR